MAQLRTKNGKVVDTEGLTPKQIARVESLIKSDHSPKARALAATLRDKNNMVTGQPVGGMVPQEEQMVTGQPVGGMSPTVTGQPVGGMVPQPAAPTTTTDRMMKTKKGKEFSVQGLNSNQLSKVRELVKTGHGPKARALAATFRKKNGAVTAPGALDPDLGIDEKTGGIDPSDMFASAQAHWNDDQAQKLRGEAQDAAYNFTTRNYATDKAREMEAAKQEAAMRGIPYDPGNPESAYGRSIGGIDRKYADLDLQAKNLALSQGNDIYQTELQGKNSSFDSFMQAALGMSSADLQKYGIDTNKLLELKKIKAQKDIEAARLSAAKAAAGGGGGGGEGGDIILNQGFNV